MSNPAGPTGLKMGPGLPMPETKRTADLSHGPAGDTGRTVLTGALTTPPDVG
jgi:hypothetical protein